MTTSGCRTASQSLMWFSTLTPFSLREARAGSMLVEWGEQARPNGRIRYWNALPPKEPQKLPVRWKAGYVEVRTCPTDISWQTNPLDWIWLTKVEIVSILNLNTLRDRFKCLRSRIGSLLGNYEIVAVKGRLPVQRRNTFYSLLCQQGVYFLFQYPTCCGLTADRTAPLKFGGQEWNSLGIATWPYPKLSSRK